MMNHPSPKGKPKKQPVWVTIVYVIGIVVCIGSYVFTEATGYLIPGLSPFSLTAVLSVYTYQHYQENRDNKNGMLKPQLAILGLLIGVTVISGLMQLYAALVSGI